jgi:hypothetical protein
MIFVSFASGGWSWGLMDDMGLATLSGSVWQRFTGLVQNFLAEGRFHPIITFHSAFFYKIFSNSPQGFYLFRWFEVVLALGVWSLLVYRLTNNKFAVPLFLAITLSFYKFYDAFFYLSIQEILGVLFSGLAALFIFKGIREA